MKTKSIIIIIAIIIGVISSGKLVCTGGKTEKDVYRSVNQLHNLLEEKDLMIYD